MREPPNAPPPNDAETPSRAAPDPPPTATYRPAKSGRPHQPVPELPNPFGRYEIVRPLGSGGMGAVYLARDTQLQRQVALKVPSFRGDEGRQVLERFLREARLAAKLHHRNICPVHDVGTFAGIHYLTMAFIDGRPLSEFVNRNKPVAERMAAALVRLLARALAAAHAQNVVHRDLKPSNVMIDQQRQPVILDFGLAHRVGTGDARLTRDGAIIGTPAYMPPEQARGDRDALGPACDIYSLGVILYELITGRLPFEGSVGAVLAKILTEPAPPPSSLRPQLDPRLEVVCMNAMAGEPASRFATMSKFEVALTEYLRASQQEPHVATAGHVTEETEYVLLPAPSTPALPLPAQSTFGDSAAADRPTRRTKPRRESSPVADKPPWGIAIGGLIFAAVLFAAWFLLPPQRQADRQQQPAGRARADRAPAAFFGGTRQQSRNNLKKVGTALLTHHDAHNALPVNGLVEKPAQLPHSWMTRLLPYVDQPAIYQRVNFQLAWNDPKNHEPFAAQVPDYLIPGIQKRQTDDDYGAAHYAGNNRLFGLDTASRVTRVNDGLQNTLAAGEVVDHFAPWASHRNLRDPVDGINRSADGFGSPWTDGAHFLMADGSVRFLRNDIDPAVLKALSTPSGGEIIPNGVLTE